MAKKRFSPEQVVAKLRQIEVLTAGGGHACGRTPLPRHIICCQVWTYQAVWALMSCAD